MLPVDLSCVGMRAAEYPAGVRESACGPYEHRVRREWRRSGVSERAGRYGPRIEKMQPWEMYTAAFPSEGKEMQPCTEQSSSVGELEASMAFKLHAYHKTLRAYLYSSTTISEGESVWKFEHVRWTKCRSSPPGSIIGAEGGEVIH